MRKLIVIFNILFVFTTFNLIAQPSIDYSKSTEYEIGGITISGVKYLSEDALILISELYIGQKITIPGDETTKAIQKLWKQGLFSDVQILITKIIDSKVYLNIYLQERPRLLRIDYYGVKKSEQEEIVEKIPLTAGGQVTENNLNNTKNIIRDYYAEKGFYKTTVDIFQKDDTTLQNIVILEINVEKFDKIKIDEIIVEGNEVFTINKIRRSLKDTKQKLWYRFYKPSRYIEDKFETDKETLIAKYNEEGYRDAKIELDSVYEFDEKTVNLFMKINEGNQYFFRDITWIGNTKYTSLELSKLLDIKKGDVYDQARLENRLTIEDDAVGNLYLDDGYLFFQAIPRELIIENDSVDLEIMLWEGPQASINRITVAGNSRTNDRVVIRELKTLPGELFSKADIIRSIRELAMLGSFDPEQLTPSPLPNQTDGTVDIEYGVVERSNDMFELSGGWGGGMFVGRVGLSFNNFSTKNFFDKKSWQPLPTGDGQKLSISVQASGKYYQMYSVSFVEPWLGGKKPTSLSVSLYHNSIGSQTGYYDVEPGAMKLWGASSGFGKRLRVPDDYFTLYGELSLQKYILKKKTTYLDAPLGNYNIISANITFGRSSVDNPLYSRSGGEFSVTGQSTLPYSLFFGTDFNEKFNLVEFYKVAIKTSWYNQIVGDLVIHSKIEYGILGYFDKNLGYSPFESYVVGGSGMGYYTFGKDIIAQRGYKDESLTPANGGHIYNKYTIELRYPAVLSESANIYGLGFLEAGNCWNSLNEFNPFDIYRAAGVGVRVFLPMLGQLGIDWGWGFDEVPGQPDANGSQIHFVFGQQF